MSSINKVGKLLDEGMHPYRIADELGLKLSTVRVYKCRLGRTRKRRLLTYLEKLEAVTVKLKTGKRNGVIAEKFGVSETQIGNLFRRCGISHWTQRAPYNRMRRPDVLDLASTYSTLEEFRQGEPESYWHAYDNGYVLEVIDNIVNTA